MKYDKVLLDAPCSGLGVLSKVHQQMNCEYFSCIKLTLDNIRTFVSSIFNIFYSLLLLHILNEVKRSI